MSGCAQGYLSAITDAVIINHAPIGCSGDNMGANNAKKWGEHVQKKPHEDIAIFNTNMDENDTVFGAIEKLRVTIREAYSSKHPAAIFITTSCVSAVIGEDIGSTADELQQELGIPVIPVSCEGFKTKVWATGFDAAFHAILTGITKPPRKKNNTVNVINFRGSTADELGELFEYLGVKALPIAGYCSVEELSYVSESAATVSVCGTLGSYMGNGLEQLYGVPYVKSLQPHGVVGFEDWLTKLGVVLNKQAEAKEYITLQREKYLPQIAEIRERLKGIRAVVGMGPGFAFNFTRILGELGVEVISTFAWHLDQRYDHGAVPESLNYLRQHRPTLPVSINDLQYNEVNNTLNELKPDLYFYRHPSNAGIIMKLGIPAISVVDEYMGFGYKGLISFGRTILSVLENCNFEKKLALNTKLPFTEWWLSQSPAALLQSEE